MKKRKVSMNMTAMMSNNNDSSPTAFNRSYGNRTPDLAKMPTSNFLSQSPGKRADVCGVMKARMPAARDGHSAVMYGDHMIVFGGDRHRMPFADTY